MDISTGRAVFRDRLNELSEICQTGSPLAFVCACAFVEYAAKLAEGKDWGSQGYKDFVRTRMAAVRQEYGTFRFRGGQTDLPDQMYHVLRCGIVHSFSLIPDRKARRKGGRDRSIVLLHRKESQERKIPHLSIYPPGRIADAAAFVAEDFVADIKTAVELVFEEAQSNPKLKSDVERWLKKHPPISGEF